MNIERFNPKDTTCDYGIVCKGPKDCQLLKGVNHQLTISVNMEHIFGKRIVRWDINKAKDFLKRSVMTAGNCPMAEDIQTRGQELIKNKFGSSF